MTTYRFSFRKDTAANWTSVNPTLLASEIGYETDTERWKMGNGTSAWDGLAYIDELGGAVITVAGRVGEVVLTKADVGLSNVDNTSDLLKPISNATSAALGGKEPSIAAGTSAQYYRGDKTMQALNKAAVGLSNVDNTSDLLKPISTAQAAINANKADLVGGLVPTSQIPPLAINETFTAASQAAMLALTAQRGDMAIRTDSSKTFVLATDSPTTLADWKEIAAGGQVISVAGRTGVVALTKADVGLSSVDNVSDANKPVSIYQQAALNALSTTISEKMPIFIRLWHPGSPGSWDNRPALPAEWPCFAISTNDNAATPPPGAFDIDIWIKRPVGA